MLSSVLCVNVTLCKEGVVAYERESTSTNPVSSTLRSFLLKEAIVTKRISFDNIINMEAILLIYLPKAQSILVEIYGIQLFDVMAQCVDGKLFHLYTVV